MASQIHMQVLKNSSPFTVIANIFFRFLVPIPDIKADLYRKQQISKKIWGNLRKPLVKKKKKRKN